MSLVCKHPRFGGFHLYDTRAVINHKALYPDFNRLDEDVYQKHRKRNMSRIEYKHQDKKRVYTRSPNAAYHEENTYRFYKDFQPVNESTLLKALNVFVELANVKPDSTIVIKAERVCVFPYADAMSWSCEHLCTKGILCIDADNIKGGTIEVQSYDRTEKLVKAVSPGYMAIFTSKHKITDMKSLNDVMEGYTDFLTFEV